MSRWDVVFSHGAHVVFGLALSLLAAQEESLLALHDMHELFVHFRTLGSEELRWLGLRLCVRARVRIRAMG